MAIKLVLSSQEILDKVFPGAPRGYDPFIVDEYLDKIIKDYLLVEANVLEKTDYVENLLRENEKLKKEKQELEIELGKYKERFSNIKASDNVTTDNMELLKTINRYEKFIYNLGYNPKTIK